MSRKLALGIVILLALAAMAALVALPRARSSPLATAGTPTPEWPVATEQAVVNALSPIREVTATPAPTTRPEALEFPSATATTAVTKPLPASPSHTPSPTDTATAVPTAPPSSASGARLIIPAIGVNAVIVAVGRDANGSMASPAGWFEIGWYRHGPRPGYPGSAALAGHLDTNTGAPAAFWSLNQLIPGSEVIYQAADGTRLTFVVEEVTSYPWDQVPLDRVFARGGDPRVALITCGGTWSRENRNYSLRTIAYGRLR